MTLDDKITYKGKITFEPEVITTKQLNQSVWKKTAMVIIEGDLCDYYSWFLDYNYGLKLIKPIRKAHVTFINDRFTDIEGEDEIQKEKLWKEIREKYEGKEVEITLTLTPRSDTKHWWLNIIEEHRDELHSIRKELGLSERPYSGLHMTIGYTNDKNAHISKNIRDLLIFNS